MEKYKEIIEENKKLIKDHEINIEILKGENKELTEKVSSLESHINEQDEKIQSLENHILKIENDIEEIKERDEPITIREGFVSLERYIMFEILGTKKKARKYHSVKDLFNDKQYETECKDFLTKYKITQDHIFIIPDMKENGNKSAHERPPMNRKDFESIIISYCEDEEDKEIVKDLLKYLEIKNPYDIHTGSWKINKPY